MDKQQASKLLGLEPGASSDAINSAYQIKQSMLEEKIAAAPTDALKAKLKKMHAALEQAHEVLLAQPLQTEPSEKKSSQKTQNPKRSPLSETKLHDIPGVAPADIEQLALEPGYQLAGRYTIEEQIGAGGMGAVYSAIDANTNEPVAIKLMLPSLVKNQRAQQRFMDEARISQKLSHPNIVNVYDVQQDGELYFLTMELLEGQDLRSYLENLKLSHQPVPQAEAIRIVQGVCDALAYAHKTTVHRDIKPENIWLADDGQIKVMDFGLARLQSTSQRSSSGAVLGTAYYMAPEQIQGRSDVDGRVDQYALGVLLYEMLSGQIPAGRIQSLHTLNKEIPKKLSLTIDKLLSTQAEERFASVDELKAALDNTSGFVMPSLPFKGLGIAAGVLLAVLLVGGLVGGGGLDNIWEALKPVDKELIAKQKAEAAKLIGEIKNYKQRLENGRRQLNSDLRDASRNGSADKKYLEHWQTVTDNYLFEGNQLTALEGELTAGESLLRDKSTEQAKATLTQVRDGYKTLWEQFNAAEKLLEAEEASQTAYQRWSQRKSGYGVSSDDEENQALSSEQDAEDSQLGGRFSAAVSHWQEAEGYWQKAYRSVDSDVAVIDKKRAVDKAERERASRVKAKVEKERKRRAAVRKELQRIDDLKRQIYDGYVYIPPGTYLKEDYSGKLVEHEVTHSYGIGAYEVTYRDFDKCVEAKACSRPLSPREISQKWINASKWPANKPRPVAKGSHRGNNPVVQVSQADATRYALWLSSVTGKKFRLPTDGEWRRAAQADAKTTFAWGNKFSCDQLAFSTGYDSQCTSHFRKKFYPRYTERSLPSGYYHSVGQYPPNKFGLYDMYGGVSEIIKDQRDAVGGDKSSKRIEYIRLGTRILTSYSVGNSSPVGFRLVQILSD